MRSNTGRREAWRSGALCTGWAQGALSFALALVGAVGLGGVVDTGAAQAAADSRQHEPIGWASAHGGTRTARAPAQ